MNQAVSIAGAIIIGGALIASVVFFNDSTVTAAEVATRDSKSHVYGNPKAATTIVEFSDFECPFCSRLHPTLKQIVDESDGAINWEYRHLPLPMHRSAELSAYVSECVAKYVGEDEFWAFTDELFAAQRSISEDFLTTLAGEYGLDEDTLQTCVADDSIKDLVASDVAAAGVLGGNATPFNVVVFPDNTIRTVPGALPYEYWQSDLEIEESTL